ncbi:MULTISPECIES: TetR/AcrR family transcriptional regulator [unclassified Brevibacterium]|uniref:TetR/AcrR family transcriptional regulator n=1 Tax=unclassified Brevibacterium TaxID=2614124 RepID=UPI001BAE2EA1|nr:TetR/AcrR family transcriptional regulator [Brevibacterium sp. W7.2]
MMRGRPPAFERDQALLEAARLFWRHGYSGTSTRALTSAIGISSSSLYAAFGSKAGLFAEAVEVYAQRYAEIYRRAVAADAIGEVVETLLRESIIEFTQDPAVHPGCMVTSAIITDSAEASDAGEIISAMQAENARLLHARITRAVEDGELPADASPTALTDAVQAVWLGLSAQSNQGMSRERLLRAADLAAHALWGTCTAEA